MRSAAPIALTRPTLWLRRRERVAPRASRWLGRGNVSGHSPDLECSPQATAALALRVAGGLLAAIVLTAAVVRLVACAPARRWLDYPFTGVPATAREAAAIFAHNARALLGLFGLLLIAQSAARNPGRPSRVQLALRAIAEVILSGVLAANVFVVGAALGAYGTRMVRAMLPHGPVELAAFAVAIALYLQGRTRPLPARQLLVAGAGSAGLLAGAALLEALVIV